MSIDAIQIDGDRRITDRRHVRTMRMRRHLAVAGLALVAFLASGPTTSTLAGLLVLSAFVGVVIGSLARAADARLGYWWGWLYGEPMRPTKLDLVIEGLVARHTAVLGRRRLAEPSDPSVHSEDSMVRIVPIE